MEPNRIFLFQGLLIAFAVGLAASSAFVSDSVVETQRSTGRNLLQTKKPCPVSFEFMNYTIFTSQCRAPQYPAKLCCGAFLEFACPYADELNDLTNDCASVMFSYIDRIGKYPPGLFATECKGDKQGLPCPAGSPQPSQNADASAASFARVASSRIGLVSALVLGFLSSWTDACNE
ncbi:GPI-anchored protein LLG1-like [Asparagus officinalis]|uniref:GPI-anchored protein LLG1-like n=1 Tax=Asparagus officinalis TaxID=4686 RepID=UPI00098DEAB1|nr:GPI-anchored protein LLG1-like [Asparagus officinalis]